MKSPSPSLQRLRTLLLDPAPAAASAVAALAAERERLADQALAGELLAAEARWLQQQSGADAAFGAVRETALHEWLAQRVRGLLEAPPDAAVLLDLAEAQAEAIVRGAAALAAACATAIAAIAPRLPPGEAVDEEVAERFAALSTAIDDVPIRHQVELLRCVGRAVVVLAVRATTPTCRRLGRRLLRAADDRELAARLERAIGARGVTRVETTNFALLLVVLGTLLVESACKLSPVQETVLHWVDAIACSFFLADFLFELLLHPRRVSWFLRNALTDLLPAIPSVLFLLPSFDAPGDVADGVVLLRVLRLMRVTWAARYVQALRPLLRSLRLLLFLVRGLDGLVARFAQLLNRDFVFVPAATELRRTVVEADERDLVFAALRREHQLIALLPAAEQRDVCMARARRLGELARATPAVAAVPKDADASAREIPIDVAIEFLWALRPQDLGRWLRPADVQSLDRVVQVLSAAPVRWLPIIRTFAVCPLPATPEERIVAAARGVAEWLESWHGRLLFHADLHGIVTGPQILDRIATAMVKATQRPAIRLILFGGLFSLPRALGLHFGSTVSTSLLVLGGICFCLLLLGTWLKRLAGQASEAFRLTAEAHFISQLEQVKHRYAAADLAFLARRVFGAGTAATHCERALRAQLASVRTGVPAADADTPAVVRLEANRTALLYLHYLDGAPLHASDVQTTEQLIANASLQNLRQHFLGNDARERKRLRKLKLDDGTLFSGPFLWFRFITESIAVEAAKRITGYNRFCVSLAERDAASPATLATMQDWLRRRRDPRGGRTAADPGAVPRAVGYPTTEFTAQDFLGGDPERDRHLESLFGAEVLEVVRIDRRTMVREIFGTRPVHHLPKHDRSFNPLLFYRRRLSRGRVLLVPLLLAWRLLRGLGWVVARVRQIVREVIDPELAMQRREIGQAPFAVAMRKIHRMKAPGLLAAMRLRLALDPVYAGAPPGWSTGEPFDGESEVERDVRFLHLRERAAAELRDAAASVRAQVTALHAALAGLPAMPAANDEDRAAGELAVTCAWLADREQVRTLWAAGRWIEEVLPGLASEGLRLGGLRRGWNALCGLFVVHPVDRWLQRQGRPADRATAAALHVAWQQDRAGARAVVAACNALAPGLDPRDAVAGSLAAVFRQGSAVQRDLRALRAVQSLAVLDIRNYRDLVFQLGDYAADGNGEDPAAELP